MANTPLQNGMGHIYGPGREVNTAGMNPVWLEQRGSKIMGGIIDLQYQYPSTTKKVVDFYPSAMRTATPCHQVAVGKYVPVPTFRVLEDVGAKTTVVLAQWEDTALLQPGINLAVAGDPSKTILTSGDNLVKQDDGTYKLTIGSKALGDLKAGDALTLKETANWKIAGLTKANLDYQGADPTSKLNITLVDNGRLLEGTAPALPEVWKDKLQTIKYEEE